jgi:soluble lytic murein transglycosylase-like protein
VAGLRGFLLAAAAVFVVVPAWADQPVSVLSSDDAQRYRQIFEDERTGNFTEAQALVAQLNDRSLVGYAQAEHYLSAYSDRATVDELVSWLQQYRDLPIADRIYTLAVKRATKTIKRHHRVVAVEVTATIPTPAAPPRLRGGGYEDVDQAEQTISSEAGRAALSQISASIRADQPAQADATLQALVSAGNVPGSDIARLSQRVAASYLAEGQDFEAFDVASRVTSYDRSSAPLLDWDTGLAAYRMGKFDVAANHFETLAQNGAVPSWTRSAAAFWAARAYTQSGEPLRVVTLLTAAAREEPTFYGMLAERILGLNDDVGLFDPVVDTSSFAALMEIPSAHRAVALWQIGRTQDLHEEMARALADMNLRDGQTYAAIARRMSLPDLELRASETAAARGTMLTGLFPVPGYTPTGGYYVDRSLVLAIARIESRFQADAISPAGARGLMQLMPATASHLAGGAATNGELREPSYNLNLGQRYLAELLDTTNGNVFQLAAAYNAGPGSLQRWLAARDGKHDDPLLFIESMPSPETRSYVKRLMTYYWMYSKRMGEAAPTLDETAAGDWPHYRPHRPTLPSLAPAAPLPQQPKQPDTSANTLVSDASLPH